MKIVVNDGGHGLDRDNFSPDKTYRESVFTLKMSKLVEYKLSIFKDKIKSELTRNCTIDIPLTLRTEIANSYSPDLLMSHHSNAVGNGDWNDARGITIYYSQEDKRREDSLKFAKMLEKYFKENIPEMPIRGIKSRESKTRPGEDYYTILDKTICPSVIIEYGFHTNKEDLKLLSDESYMNKAADCVILACAEYFDIPFKFSKYFDDVPPNHWSVNYIDRAVESGILHGTGNRTFDFGKLITREESVALMMKMYDSLEDKIKKGFFG